LKKGNTVNATYFTVMEAQNDGAITENVGLFILTIINFIVIALFLWIIVQLICGIKDKLKHEEHAKTMKTCESCRESIKIQATKCKWCCSSQ